MASLSGDKSLVKVLLVDDQPANLLTLEAVLEDVGYPLVRAASGAEAVERLLRDEYAVILLDIQMPDLDGYETARLIRAAELAPDTPILFLTAALHSEERIALGYEVGAVDYLTKPFDPQVLRAKVSAYASLRQKARLETSRAEARHAAILEGALDAVISIDHRDRVLEWNPAAERLFGYAVPEAIGATLCDLIIPATHCQCHREGLARYVDTGVGPILGRRLELPARRKDGTEFPVELTITPLPAASPPVFTAFLRDLSAQKRAEEQQRDSEAQFRLLVEQSPLSIQVLSPDGWTLQVNRAWENLWGLKLEQLQAARYNMLQDPQLVEKGIMPYIRRGFGGEAAEIPAILYDVEESLPDLAAPGDPGRWVRAVIYPVRDDGGQVRKVVLIHEDITERKRLEDQLQLRVQALAEADRRKDEFLAMLGHELRNPLGAVSNALFLMGRAAPESAAFASARDTALRQVQHQTRIVNDLLDVSRIGQGKITLRCEGLDLAQLAADACEDQRPEIETAGLMLAVHLPGVPVPVCGDRTRLTQVLDNLLDNARKFTGGGGEISVELTLDGDGGHAALSVTDSGIGFDAATGASLFEPFIQAEHSLHRSSGGLGLGLALVKGLVSLHGGTIVAESPGLGGGAAFRIRLPLTTAPSGPQAPPAATGPRVVPLQILVIEDNRDGAETLRDLLELSGYAVELAFTGPEGLEKARASRPEVVLCDIGLPGLNGYEVAAELKRDPETAALRLVAVSGYGSAEDRQRSEAAGFDCHLVKPINLDELQRVLSGDP